ncbi:hypothetical protein KSE_11150 [Kitasatospora setae KM-6054]|uniref:Uncharacterized protein n=1 Tax=Kitasatospora setae (strain ATCC 33774 / DSM 43861 / JCM 3304 / KCC A-0304 / NBRC 14216 / KM-6054) TaxID=452652 RepID=E4N6W8_KITSK|nr:hypothetical protein KSE_11150 [Kitasatospora setae KM-6054]
MVRGGAEVDVVVTARTLVRDLLVQADRIDPAATADRGLTTLLPGERAVIRIRGLAATPSGAWVRAAVFCVEPS